MNYPVSGRYYTNQNISAFFFLTNSPLPPVVWNWTNIGRYMFFPNMFYSHVSSLIIILYLGYFLVSVGSNVIIIFTSRFGHWMPFFQLADFFIVSKGIHKSIVVLTIYILGFSWGILSLNCNQLIFKEH